MMKTPATIAFFACLCFSCNTNTLSPAIEEATDPDPVESLIWENVERGLQSSFGSTDIAYPKSTPPEKGLADSIVLHAWKGERINCTLLVWSEEDVKNISIETKGLRNGDSWIKKEDVSIGAVQYVLTDQFLNEKGGACGPRENDKIPSHLSPDLIGNRTAFSLESKTTRPVWISIHVPFDASEGIYSGSIRIKSKSGSRKHEIKLEVFNKVLPAPTEWAFHLDLWQNPYAIARYHEVDLWSPEHIELLKPYLTMLADAGQKCITAILIEKPWDGGPCYDPFHSMISWTKKKDGSWEYDYSIFDRYVSLAMECGIRKQINCYSMVPLTNKFSWYDEATEETRVSQYIPGTADYEEYWTPFILDFKSHLTEKAWLEKTTIALDEREPEEMAAMFEFMGRVAPEIKIAMAGFYYAEVNSSIYDFSSNWRDYGRIPDTAIQTRKDAGLLTTYYVACGIPEPNNFTFSPPSESCYEAWIAAAMGFDGFLRWAYNSWPENPLIDSRYVKWPAGDTYFIYPGPLSSVRFERLREGIQDYEKIRILREELKESESEQANTASARLEDFLTSIHAKTLKDQSAAEILAKGKQILNELSLLTK